MTKPVHVSQVVKTGKITEPKPVKPPTTHVSDMPASTCCDYCGLNKDFWEKVPECPIFSS